ncbi:MAG: hypothetical protein Q4P72_00765 [Eubacteriales bacterium]|nr:hypothetical protein [Eubacteriales bacterium]
MQLLDLFFSGVSFAIAYILGRSLSKRGEDLRKYRGLQQIWRATGIGFILLGVLIHFEPRALVPHLVFSFLIILIALFMTQREIRRYLLDLGGSDVSDDASDVLKK